MQGSEGMHGEVRSCTSIVSENLVVLSVGASTGQFSAADSAAITSTKSNNYWTFCSPIVSTLCNRQEKLPTCP